MFHRCADADLVVSVLLKEGISSSIGLFRVIQHLFLLHREKPGAERLAEPGEGVHDRSRLQGQGHQPA